MPWPSTLPGQLALLQRAWASWHISFSHCPTRGRASSRSDRRLGATSYAQALCSISCSSDSNNRAGALCRLLLQALLLRALAMAVPTVAGAKVARERGCAVTGPRGLSPEASCAVCLCRCSVWWYEP
jgi:hypothetical protein